MARLIVIKGADEGKQFELADKVAGIGRERTNEICLHDTEGFPTPRGDHTPSANGAYLLRDIGSVNGTLVNTRPVQEAVLNSGDHLQIGQTILVFTAGRTDGQPASDLADRIRLVAKQDLELTSAIVKTIGENEGSHFLARPQQAQTQWLKDRLANLSIMYETIQAVSHILDLDELLEKIMELIFASIEADHGCIMVRNMDSNAFEPKAIRFRDEEKAGEKMVLSRTSMEYVPGERSKEYWSMTRARTTASPRTASNGSTSSKLSACR